MLLQNQVYIIEEHVVCKWVGKGGGGNSAPTSLGSWIWVGPQALRGTYAPNWASQIVRAAQGVIVTLHRAPTRELDMVQVPTSLWDTGPDTGLGVAGMQRSVFANQRLFNIYILTVAPSSHASLLPSNPTRIRFVSPASGTTAESPARTSQKPACRLLTIALPFLKMGNAKWVSANHSSSKLKQGRTGRVKCRMVVSTMNASMNFSLTMNMRPSNPRRSQLIKTKQTNKNHRESF